MKFRAAHIISLLAILLSLGGLLWTYLALRGAGSGPFILHFDDIEGVRAVGGRGNLFFVGILGIVITVANFFIALELEKKDGFLGKIFAAVTFIFAVLLFIAFAAIINVN